MSMYAVLSDVTLPNIASTGSSSVLDIFTWLLDVSLFLDVGLRTDVFLHITAFYSVNLQCLAQKINIYPTHLKAEGITSDECALEKRRLVVRYSQFMPANMERLKNELETIARDMGGKAFGVADLEKLKIHAPHLLKCVPGDYSRAIVFGVRLQRAALEDIADRPTPLYFHNYRQINYQLDSMAMLVADMVQDAGFRAIAIPASQIISKDPMRGHVSHKLLGWAAGIGFIGRNSLLIHQEYGAQMRYVSVLTDAPLEAGAPCEDNCGSCMACISVCPASAIREKREEFDLNACYLKLTEFTRIPFIGQHICGVCVKACDGKR